jgi:leader peptidase (prepilin peptidase)/N-methyltransferase
LPFAITIPLMFVGLTGAAFFQMRPVMDSLIGIGVGAAIFAILIFGGKWVFKKEAMGGGDLVFGMMAGAFLGWKLTIFMLFIASFLGTLIALFMLILGKDIAGKMLPFGPFLAVAMVLSLLLGDSMIGWYVGLFQH